MAGAVAVSGGKVSISARSSGVWPSAAIERTTAAALALAAEELLLDELERELAAAR